MGTKVYSEMFGRRMLRRSSSSRAGGFEIGLLIPASGPMGMLGPSALACARLACETWNATGGVRGREVRLTVLDAGEPSARLESELDRLLDDERLDALVTMSTTPVGHQVSEVVDARVPMVFTTQFEGSGLPAWVHAIGETPDRQLLPAISWMAEHCGVRRWYLLGNDYCWPRHTHRAAAAHLRGMGAQVAGERYLPLGERVFEPVVEDIARTRADVVLISLIGADSIHMCRAFGEAGLAGRVLRLSSSIEENALLGMGHRNTAGMFAVSGYFPSIESAANADFKERYHARFGERAPALNSLAQSVYEGLVHLQRQALDHDRPPRREPTLASVRTQHQRDSGYGAEPIFLAQADGLTMRVIQPLEAAAARR